MNSRFRAIQVRQEDQGLVRSGCHLIPAISCHLTFPPSYGGIPSVHPAGGRATVHKDSEKTTILRVDWPTLSTIHPPLENGIPFHTNSTTPVLSGLSTWSTLRPTMRRPDIIVQRTPVASSTPRTVLRDQSPAFHANKPCFSVLIYRHASSRMIDLGLPSTGHTAAFKPFRTVLSTLAPHMLWRELADVLHAQTCETGPIVAFVVVLSKVQAMQLALGLTVVVSMEVSADFVLIDSV